MLEPGLELDLVRGVLPLNLTLTLTLTLTPTPTPNQVRDFTVQGVQARPSIRPALVQ